jgi:hypothetical protein
MIVNGYSCGDNPFSDVSHFYIAVVFYFDFHPTASWHYASNSQSQVIAEDHIILEAHEHGSPRFCLPSSGFGSDCMNSCATEEYILFRNRSRLSGLQYISDNITNKNVRSAESKLCSSGWFQREYGFLRTVNRHFGDQNVVAMCIIISCYYPLIDGFTL